MVPNEERNIKVIKLLCFYFSFVKGEKEGGTKNSLKDIHSRILYQENLSTGK